MIHRLICPETNPSPCRLHATGGRYAQNSVADMVQKQTKRKQTDCTLEITFALALVRSLLKERGVCVGIMMQERRWRAARESACDELLRSEGEGRPV
jgi:hypothetical protein